MCNQNERHKKSETKRNENLIVIMWSDKFGFDLRAIKSPTFRRWKWLRARKMWYQTADFPLLRHSNIVVPNRMMNAVGNWNSELTAVALCRLRFYWSNELTSITSDRVINSRLILTCLAALGMFQMRSKFEKLQHKHRRVHTYVGFRYEYA